MGDHFSGVGACLACCHQGPGEASVPNESHDHLDHVLVRQKSQQLAGEATVPHSVIISRQIDKHDTSLLFCLKRILNVLPKQNNLIYGRLSVSKFILFLWKQGVDYWFDTIVDQSFEDLVRDAEQRDGTVALWVLYKSTSFKGLGITTTNALLQTFGILSWRKQEEKKRRSQNFKPGPA